MTSQPSKYRFLLINAFSLAPGSSFQLRSFTGPKETQLYNYEDLKPFLADIDWDLHPGARATHGNWPVTTKFEFMSVGYNRLPLVKEACASGKYNAIVLLGGGDPGYMEAREIGRQYRIPITTSAHAQMHIAGLLGNKFSIVDIAETHNMQMYHLVVQYRMTDRCASIRNVNFPLPVPNHPDDRPIQAERDPKKTASTQTPRRQRLQGLPPGFEQFFGNPDDQEDQGAAASGTSPPPPCPRGGSLHQARRGPLYPVPM